MPNYNWKTKPSCLDSAYERIAIERGLMNNPVFPENKVENGTQGDIPSVAISDAEWQLMEINKEAASDMGLSLEQYVKLVKAPSPVTLVYAWIKENKLSLENFTKLTKHTAEWT